MKPHWHEHNPWKDELLYITMDEVEKLWSKINTDLVHHYTRGFGNELDAYLLPSYHMGIRYGAEGHEYLSPQVDPDKLVRFLFTKAKAAPYMLQALQIAEESYENFVAGGRDDGTLGVIRSAIKKARGL